MRGKVNVSVNKLLYNGHTRKIMVTQRTDLPLSSPTRLVQVCPHHLVHNLLAVSHVEIYRTKHSFLKVDGESGYHAS